ncbi:hypothetical protein L1049_011725 [Liquidambar formosana]|uniref:Uncharacterized protein n=1 Tax=Liquidambar formosana TaxID=63359 RepID=A0AAP0WX86_LIQFO
MGLNTFASHERIREHKDGTNFDGCHPKPKNCLCQTIKIGRRHPSIKTNYISSLITPKMPVSEISVGSLKDATSRDAIQAGFAEFISTFIFVFAGQGSGMAFEKITRGRGRVDGIIAIAMAHSMGFVAGVAVSKNISGGHVNPAVTFGAFVGGHRRLSLIKLISYWIGQLLGSIFACLLLKLATNNMDIRAFVLVRRFHSAECSSEGDSDDLRLCLQSVCHCH